MSRKDKKGKKDSKSRKSRKNTLKDVLKNAALGGLIGGTIGTTIDYYNCKKNLKRAGINNPSTANILKCVKDGNINAISSFKNRFFPKNQESEELEKSDNSNFGRKYRRRSHKRSHRKSHRRSRK